MQLSLPLPELQLPVDGTFPPAAAHRIYCNRSLRLDLVDWVGFDMDYTLAIYEQSEMDRLSIEATAQKLVERGYPEHLLTMSYRVDFAIRGLLIDRRLGNVLKMDRYKYVKRAYHGMRELSRDERRRIYHSKRLRPGTKRYHWVDTLYALSEVSVFAAVIDALERDGGSVDYDTLFSDVRECIDAAHRDGSILNAVMSDLPRFVRKDPLLAETLHKLRSAGKKLFVLTNSHAPYTRAMMSYLLDEEAAEYASWQQYFDLVVTAATKPRFFTGDAPFEEVTDEGELVPAHRLERGRIYAGGNIGEFEQRLGVPGDRVLYVGDHIYGDVLRAKKESAWRTMMIIQEMVDELETQEELRDSIVRLDDLDDIRGGLHDDLRERQARLKGVQRTRDQLEGEGTNIPPELEAVRARHRRAIDRLRARLKAADHEYSLLEDQIGTAFHSFWGPLFKAGPEVSIFGDQVEQWACVYTTCVTNLRLYSPMHYFRSPRDRMPHEP